MDKKSLNKTAMLIFVSAVICICLVLLIVLYVGPSKKPTTEEQTYLLKMLNHLGRTSDSLNDYYKAYSDFENRDISVSEHKEEIKKLIVEINVAYSLCSATEPPTKRLESFHEKFIEAMEHYHNACLHLQEYVDTDDEVEMHIYLIDAFIDLKRGDRSLKKASEELQQISK